MLENVYAVTDLDAPPLYRNLQATKLGLATDGFWDLRASVWSDMQERTPDLASFASVEAWKQMRRAQTRAFVLERVPDATEADLLAAEAKTLNATSIVQRFNGRLNIAEARWIDGHAVLADQATRFGYLRPTKAQRAIIRKRLSEPRGPARRTAGFHQSERVSAARNQNVQAQLAQNRRDTAADFRTALAERG